MDMPSWSIWLLFAGAVVMFEIFTGTFYLLMVAIGLLAGMLVALLGGNLAAQCSTAGVVAVLAVLLLRRSKWGRLNKTDPAKDSNVNLDIGQVLHVAQWQADGQERYTARVQYRGAQWDVQLQPGSEAKAGPCVIREVRGSHLIVAPE